MTAARLTYSMTWWGAGLAALALVLVAWLCVRNARAAGGGFRAYAIEFLRFLAAFMLAATLFKVELVRRLPRRENPLVAVLCDASGSMKTRDVESKTGTVVARADWLQSVKDAVFWQPLEKKYRVAVSDFKMEPSGTDTNVDDGTDIDSALERVIRAHDSLRAVVLVSDGDWNAGKSPVSAATRLRMNRVPVYTVTAGSDRFLPDLELQNVMAPAYGLMDERVAIGFTIQSRLDRDVRTVVSLVGPDGVNASREIRIPAMGRLQDTILLVPKVDGDLKFELRLPVEKDEMLQDNNAREFRISLRRELLKVLVVDSLPRWEYRYLRNALMRDPGVSVQCLLLHPELGPAQGRNYIQAFPQGMDALSGYDVVFLGDVGTGAGELSEENCRMLKGLVEQQGSGLVFLPGRRGRQSTLAATELAGLMPVETDQSRPEGYGASVESQLALTARGSSHLLTMLAPDAQANAALWKRLPGFYWYAPAVRARRGSEILAVHDTARNEHGRIPLLVSRPCGSGKTLFMGTDSAWRWRRGVEDTYHYRFWGQVVRWMAHQRHIAHTEGIRFFYSPETPARGDRLYLQATVYDLAGFPAKAGAEVRAAITGPRGYNEQVALSSEPGGWGVFKGSAVLPHGGEYDVMVRCDDTGRQTGAKILVSSPKREVTGRPARSSVMREISAVSGGKSGVAADLNRIIEEISLLPESDVVEARVRLWCHPAWAGLLVLVLATYWTARKLSGLV